MNYELNLRNGKENVRGESLSVSPQDIARQSVHAHRRACVPRKRLEFNNDLTFQPQQYDELFRDIYTPVKQPEQSLSLTSLHDMNARPNIRRLLDGNLNLLHRQRNSAGSQSSGAILNPSILNPIRNITKGVSKKANHAKKNSFTKQSSILTTKRSRNETSAAETVRRNSQFSGNI